MRWCQWFFAVLVLAAVSPLQIAAQTKVGVVDFQTALLNTAHMKKEAAALEAKFKPRQDELAALSAEMQEIQVKLQSAAPEAGAALQADGQRKQRRAQRLSEDLQTDVEYDRQSILAAAGGRMREVVKQLRIDKGLDLIVDISGVLAFDDVVDLTTAATAAYDAKHPES